VFGRFSGVKGCCAIAARRPVAALDPGASAAMVGRCGQARPCPGSARRLAARELGRMPVRLLVLGLGARR
jgi:hypothetical protein